MLTASEYLALLACFQAPACSTEGFIQGIPVHMQGRDGSVVVCSQSTAQGKGSSVFSVGRLRLAGKQTYGLV